MQAYSTRDVPRLFVFSHPNHELAVYGLVQRLRPHLVYLSDGGGPRRVDQSREGLTDINLVDRATFLDQAETRFYDALLAGDRTLFDTYISEVRAAIERVQPAEIFCDAVEGYNPGHDRSLPIVRAALAGRDDVDVYELPLVHQVPGDEVGYLLQRVPTSLRDRGFEIELSPQESKSKTRARDEVYTELVRQMGADLMSGREGQLEREEFLPARTFPFDLPDEVNLRYEWRGGLLRDDGQVDEVLTYDDHWLPMVRALVPESDAARAV